MKFLAPFFTAVLATSPVMAHKAHAQSTPYCGFVTEATSSPTPPAHTVLPKDGVVVGPPLFPISASGLEDWSGIPGIALQGKHRHCGKISIYLYTGDGPSNVVDFTAVLNPGIVGTGVAQVGCTATLGKVNDVYYFGYNGEVIFPDWSIIKMAGDASWADQDGVTRKHVNFHITASEPLQPRAAYLVSLICPYNTDPQ